MCISAYYQIPVFPDFSLKGSASPQGNRNIWKLVRGWPLWTNDLPAVVLKPVSTIAHTTTNMKQTHKDTFEVNEYKPSDNDDTDNSCKLEGETSPERCNGSDTAGLCWSVLRKYSDPQSNTSVYKQCITSKRHAVKVSVKCTSSIKSKSRRPTVSNPPTKTPLHHHYWGHTMSCWYCLHDLRPTYTKL